MRHRIALAVGSLAAAGTLAVALAAAGFNPASPSLASSVGSVPAADPSLHVDTIYLPAPVTPPTITVQHVITTGGEQEGSEGGGDS